MEIGRKCHGNTDKEAKIKSLNFKLYINIYWCQEKAKRQLVLIIKVQDYEIQCIKTHGGSWEQTNIGLWLKPK